MKEGDLVYLKPRLTTSHDVDFLGLLISFEKIGSGDRGSTILYDVLVTETNEIHTLCDIYFEIWRVE